MDARDHTPADLVDSESKLSSTDRSARGTFARIGVCALNLFGPGLGLIRLGEVRRGFLLLLSSLAISATLVVALVIFAAPQPGWFLAVTIAVAIATVVLLGYAVLASWHRSSIRAEPMAPVSRWYAIIGLILVIALANDQLISAAHRYFKPFYTASASMAPTLSPGDRFVADMDFVALQRGEIILFDHAGQQWFFRLIGLPGDRVRVADGTPVINGVIASRTAAGVVRLSEGEARLFNEVLPGSERSYRVADGPFSNGMLDDMPEIVLGPDQYFLLGDNRDSAADSRISHQDMGAGIVNRAEIVGIARFVSWRSGAGLSGEEL